jgi:hypothetical protein
MLVAAIVLVGAVCSTLVAAYQWSMFAARDWKTRILSTALAVMLWLIWFYATIHASRPPKCGASFDDLKSNIQVSVLAAGQCVLCYGGGEKIK